MPARFEHRRTVRDDEIDFLGHVNNIVYLRWMLDAAIAHSTVQGWPNQRYFEMGSGWVVREHTIKYLQPAVAGDEVVVHTWVASMRRVQSLRMYEMIRVSDGARLLEASTIWAFVNFETGVLQRVPAEVTDSFIVVGES